MPKACPYILGEIFCTFTFCFAYNLIMEYYTGRLLKTDSGFPIVKAYHCEKIFSTFYSIRKKDSCIL